MSGPIGAAQFAAKLAQAEAALSRARPVRPLSAFDLFATSLKRQYGIADDSANHERVMQLVTEAWQNLGPNDRLPFEQRARQDMQRYLEEERVYDEMQVQCSALRRAVQASAAPPPALQPPGLAQPLQYATAHAAGQFSAATVAAYHQHYQAYQNHMQQQQRQVYEQQRQQQQQRQQNASQHCAPPRPAAAKRESTVPEAADVPAASPAAGGTLAAAAPVRGECVDPSDGLEVMCQGVNGTMIISEQRVICHCSSCAALPADQRSMSCTQFEIHSGAASAKKWKTSLKVRPGTQPDVPANGTGMQVGRWLELRGIDVGKAVQRATAGSAVAVSKDSQIVPMPDKAYTSERLLNRQRQEAAQGNGAQANGGDAAGWEGKDVGSGADAEAMPPPPNKQPIPSRLAAPKPEPPVKAERSHHHRHHHGGASRSEPPSQQGADRNNSGAAAAAGGKADRSFTPWRDAGEGNFSPINVRWAGERCAVCDGDTDFDYDQLVTCDVCGIAVHQSCYGVPEVPGVEDMWLCRACELKEEGRPAPQCCLCPVAGGALKPATMAGLWVHAACLQWIPEVTVDDVNTMEPVGGIRSIQRERWELLCMLCRQRMGAKIQCTTCYTSYHPLCARIAGLHMEIMDDGAESDGPITLVSYCSKHCTPQPQLSGVRLVKESEERGDLPEQSEVPGLWNGQPFQLPPPAPALRCPAGAARAMPLGGWTRRMHGTGTGASTEAAFWIPESGLKRSGVKKNGHMSPADAAAEADAAAPGSGSKAGGAGEASAAPSKAASPATGKRPVQPVELLPLPEGVPEQVTVSCNGRLGQLVVRTQRVLYCDEDMAPSRFEMICGRADAKKWKTSLVEVRRDGSLGVAMQDWLAAKRLDRKVLEALVKNAAQYQQYQQWRQLTAPAAQLIEAAAIIEADDAEQGGSDAATQREGTSAGVVLAEGRAEEASAAASEVAGAVAHDQLHADGAAAGSPPNGSPATTEPALPPAAESEQQPAAEAALAVAMAIAAAEAALQPPAVMEDAVALASGAELPLPGAAPGAADSLIAAEVVAVDHAARPSRKRPASSSGSGSDAETDPVARPMLPSHDSQQQQQQHQHEQGEEDWAAVPAAKLPPSDSGCPATKMRRLNSCQPTEPPPQPPAVDPAASSAPTAAPPHAGGEARAEWEVSLRSWVRVWWPEDEEWYLGQVKEFSRLGGQHRVWYEIDRSEEWIDLDREGRSGRLQVLPGRERAAWPDPLPPPAEPPRQRHQGRLESAAAAEAPEAAADTAAAEPAPVPLGPAEGAAAVGRRVSIFWPEEESFYHGTVRNFRADQGRHLVLYDNGHADWVDLAEARAEWPGPKKPTAKPSNLGRGAGLGDRPLPPDLPETVDVCCSGVRGVFHLRRLVVTLSSSGQEVSPTEFERQAGRAAAKKWKTSIRIDKGGGSPGVTMETWLIQMGVDQPKPSRATVDTVRRKQQQRAGNQPPPPPPLQGPSRSAARGGQGWAGGNVGALAAASAKSRTGHREGCTCIICKQARRSGKQRTVQGSGGGKGGKASGERRWRTGKRAFLAALPQVVSVGARPHEHHQVPLSRCWAPEDWAAHRLRQNQRSARDAAAAAAGGSAALPPPAMSAVLPVLIAGGASAVLDGNLAAAVSLGPFTAGSGRALTVKEKLELCCATERERLAFGKSGIHGWGLFARVPMRQDSMVVEFRGEVVRRTVADAREARYRAEGTDCYSFNLDDDVVLDATRAGTIARFTNHCCAPSLYTKILTVDGELRLAFFARYDVAAGQELTYNYRFKAEEGEERLPCACGAPTCTGFLN